jgi:hypothetical protein
MPANSKIDKGITLYPPRAHTTPRLNAGNGMQLQELLLVIREAMSLVSAEERQNLRVHTVKLDNPRYATQKWVIVSVAIEGDNLVLNTVLEF